ncbi:MAG: hypothetical protein K2K97_01990 [Muribaculaceae bacterium]|nr:hypothetical protein [Muribaculaceae bacterium]
MNLVKTCPDIPDSWKGNISDVCRILGLNYRTVRKAAEKGRRNGGIDWIAGLGGRMMFTGKEVKRFWHYC